MQDARAETNVSTKVPRIPQASGGMVWGRGRGVGCDGPRRDEAGWGEAAPRWAGVFFMLIVFFFFFQIFYNNLACLRKLNP